MWKQFIDSPQVYCQPFIDFSTNLNVQQIDFYMDASGCVGMGGVCGDKWMQANWDPQFLKLCEPSIEYLELYALMAACLRWLHNFANQRIILFCDNKSVVSMVNNTSSSCKQCMVLIRMLVLHSINVNTRVFATYVNTKLNTHTDLLSRGRVQKFKALFTHDPNPTPLPGCMWPVEKIWMK